MIQAVRSNSVYSRLRKRVSAKIKKKSINSCIFLFPPLFCFSICPSFFSSLYSSVPFSQIPEAFSQACRILLCFFLKPVHLLPFLHSFLSSLPPPNPQPSNNLLSYIPRGNTSILGVLWYVPPWESASYCKCGAGFLLMGFIRLSRLFRSKLRINLGSS